MDNRIYILPVVSIALIASIVFARPDLTGFVVSEGEISTVKYVDAQIRVSIKDGIIPEGSFVSVSLANRTSNMTMEEFIGKSGEEYDLVEGSVPEISYEGPGFLGPAEYTVDLDEFDLKVPLTEGSYVLSNSVYYEGTLLSYTEEVVEV